MSLMMHIGVHLSNKRWDQHAGAPRVDKPTLRRADAGRKPPAIWDGARRAAAVNGERKARVRRRRADDAAAVGGVARGRKGWRER